MVHRRRRVVGDKLELDEPLQGLDGKRVIVSVVDEDDDPILRALVDAPREDETLTSEERELLEARARSDRWVPHETVKAKLAARKRDAGG